MGNALRKRKSKQRKSVMQRLAPLTGAERVDLAYLLSQGMPMAEARVIAQGYDPSKQAVDKAVDNEATPAYYRAFHKASKAMLPDWQHDMLHRSARGKAGATGRSMQRARQDDLKAALLDEMDMLQKRVKEIQVEVGKSSPLASEVHVPAPMGGKRQKFTVLKGGKDQAASPVLKAQDVGLSDRQLAYIQAAYNLSAPTESVSLDTNAVDPMVEGLLEANRLVAGMDAELMVGAPDAETARRKASRTLRERPGHYDSMGAEPEVRGLRGLLLDIGSGLNRKPGWLGLDIFAYDHGTVLHDVERGLPFPDGSVRAIRLCDALHAILDAPMANPDPLPLLQECQRVLMEGGYLYYQGPEPLVEPGQNWPLPGLVLAHGTEQDFIPDVIKPGEPVVQVLRRVPLRVPGYHGADATYAPAPPLPLEVQMALQALNSVRADKAMANLIHKAQVHTPGSAQGPAPAHVRKAVNRALGDGKRVPIQKADAYKQIVYGVVLAPNEIDTQGDMMEPDEIEKSAHQWMATSRIIGLEHAEPIDAIPVESFIAPMDMQFDGPQGPVEWTQGSWIMGVKFMDQAHFQMALDGEITGFSVGGLGLRS